MGRLKLVGFFVLLLAVAAPAFSAERTERRVGCSALVGSGERAACRLAFRIPHFNSDDAIDYGSLVARIVSPQAANWIVQANIRDAAGVVYFAWYCSVRQSSVTAASSAYVDRTCMASRRTVEVEEDGQTYLDYYEADTSGAQILTAVARVEACAPTYSDGSCAFEASATYLLGRRGRTSSGPRPAGLFEELIPSTPF